MILSHKHKFVFLRVTKTGSTAANTLLRLGGDWDYETDHLSSNPGWAMAGVNLPPEPDPISTTWRHTDVAGMVDAGILTEEQVEEYDFYAFVRCPFERFVSAYYYTTLAGDLGKAGLTAEQFLERKKLYPGKSKYFTPQIVGRPQYLWFQYKGKQVVQPLYFKQFDEELRFLLDRVNGFQFPEIPVINRSKADYRGRGPLKKHVKDWGAELALDPDIRKEIEDEYAEDFKLYEMARNDAELRHGGGNPKYSGLGPKPGNLAKDASAFVGHSKPERYLPPDPVNTGT